MNTEKREEMLSEKTDITKINAMSNTECKEFEDALLAAGHGRFQYQIFAMCSLSLLCAGFQNGLAAYVFSAAQCQLNITSIQLGYIHMGFMVGGILGAFLWGITADIFGRRKVLLITLFLDFLVSVACCFMSVFYGILICRFLNGFLIGAPSSITFSYLGEFYISKNRVKSLCYCGIFFTLSWLMLPFIALFILQTSISSAVEENLEFAAWRLLLFLLALPELVGSIWLVFLPESPAFLYNRGEKNSALKILQRIYATNIKTKTCEYPIQVFRSDVKNSPMQNKIKCNGKMMRRIREFHSQMWILFKVPCLRVTVLISLITFANMFGCYGLGLWLPVLFQKFQLHENLYPDEQIKVKNFSNFKNISSNAASCVLNESLLENNGIVGVCCVIANFISAALSEKISLKIITITTMTLGGITSGCIYWLSSSQQYLIMSCIFQSVMATENIALGSVSTVYFPTKVGALALSITMMIDRIGALISNYIFGSLIDTYCEIPLFLVSTFAIFGAALCCMLPKITS